MKLNEHGPFATWRYTRPARRGDARMIEEWAIAFLSGDGSHYRTSKAITGFKSEADAIAEANAMLEDTP